MAGIVPKLGTEWGGKQIGPWFYAPWLTTIVTPIFFGFLVGPSRPNRRSDGQRGGLVVEKCKFLQESGCKGLCLHQCKIPAQEFFSEELGESFLSCGHTIDLLAPTNLHPPVNTMKLGLDLTVKPNFITQVSEHRKEGSSCFWTSLTFVNITLVLLQECQWSFGEKPLAPDEDPSFPNGCLVGCESRKAMADRKGEVLCM